MTAWLNDPALDVEEDVFNARVLDAMEQGLRAAVGSCERCGCPDGVELEASCTAYPWDGKGPNPNRPRQLCRPCAKEHYAFWAEMWAHARGG